MHTRTTPHICFASFHPHSKYNLQSAHNAKRKQNQTFDTLKIPNIYESEGG